jgi:hypothetical protein
MMVNLFKRKKQKNAALTISEKKEIATFLQNLIKEYFLFLSIVEIPSIKKYIYSSLANKSYATLSISIMEN